MAIYIVRPHHRSASAIGTIDYSVLRNINPLAIDAHAIVSILAFPIRIVEALRLAAAAAKTLATLQGLEPIVQLGMVPIVSASAADCKDREGNSHQNNRRQAPVLHFAPNPHLDRDPYPSHVPVFEGDCCYLHQK
jgi:hypothetical protein